MKILLIDDSSTMRKIQRRVLSEMNPEYDVVEAGNGKEALEKLKENRPDIVFLDIEMPELSGLDALRAIQELGTETKVVMVTATPTAQNVLAAREGGASGFLVKPVSPKKVAEAIKACKIV